MAEPAGAGPPRSKETSLAGIACIVFLVLGLVGMVTAVRVLSGGIAF